MNAATGRDTAIGVARLLALALGTIGIESITPMGACMPGCSISRLSASPSSRTFGRCALLSVAALSRVLLVVGYNIAPPSKQLTPGSRLRQPRGIGASCSHPHALVMMQAIRARRQAERLSGCRKGANAVSVSACLAT